MIDWSIYNSYEYSEGDGLYLDEKSLRAGKIVTTDTKQSFVNRKHPMGEHVINKSVGESILRDRSPLKVRCQQCNENKLTTSMNHEGIETIPLCNSCFNDNYE
jgi:formylmethanofuran dehydrogenase subunit E